MNKLQENDWQSEEDARTLIRAKEIESDKFRMRAAKEAALNMAKEQEAELLKIKHLSENRITVPLKRRKVAEMLRGLYK